MDDKLKQTMIARYQNDGHSVLDLAREFHLGQSKIREILRDSGVLRTRGAGISLAWKRGKRVRPESFTNVGRTIDVNRVREMFGAGLNPSEIGRELRVASRRVQMILASEGLIFGKGRFLCDSCENVCDGSAQRKFCSSCVTAGFHRRFAKFGVGKKVWDVMLAGSPDHERSSSYCLLREYES